MPTGPGFPGASNVFIPSTNKDVDGRLIVGFSRNADRFTFPQYAQYVKVSEPVFYYLKITNQEAARVVNTHDFMWPDGVNRPQRNRDTESFNFIPSRTERYDYGFTIGEKTVKYASWPIKEQHSQIKAAQCMTNRTVRGLSVLTTTASWGTAADPDLAVNHTSATASGLLGDTTSADYLYSGTSTDPRILKALNAMAVAITKDTLAVVQGQPDEMMILVNPETARNMAESAEIHDYLKGSPDAKGEILNNLTPNAKYGLPGSLYGYKVIVEAAVRVTGRVGAPLARGFCLADHALIMVSRVGGLEGVYGAPSFSTFTMFYIEEMSVETFDDPKNRLVEGHVVEDCVEVLTCPASGWYIANCSA
jgi:hypothetical protein